MNYKPAPARRDPDPAELSAAIRHLESVAAILRERRKVKVIPFPEREPGNVSEWLHRLRMPPAPRV